MADEEPIQIRPRLTYYEFRDEVEMADLEVSREFGYPRIDVIARSLESSIIQTNADGTLEMRYEPWGEFYPPSGPIVIYQTAYEMMPEPELYRHQIREVLRHEYRHATGQGDHDDKLAPRVSPARSSEWWGGSLAVYAYGDVKFELPDG